MNTGKISPLIQRLGILKPEQTSQEFRKRYFRRSFVKKFEVYNNKENGVET